MLLEGRGRREDEGKARGVNHGAGGDPNTCSEVELSCLTSGAVASENILNQLLALV